MIHFSDEKGESFPQADEDESSPVGAPSSTDWKTQKKIADATLFKGVERERLLIDIPFTQLALNALGKPVDVVPLRSVRLLFLAFNHFFVE